MVLQCSVNVYIDRGKQDHLFYISAHKQRIPAQEANLKGQLLWTKFLCGLPKLPWFSIVLTSKTAVILQRVASGTLLCCFVNFYLAK